jgi:hypothetical protein
LRLGRPFEKSLTEEERLFVLRVVTDAVKRGEVPPERAADAAEAIRRR